MLRQLVLFESRLKTRTVTECRPAVSPLREWGSYGRFLLGEIEKILAKTDATNRISAVAIFLYGAVVVASGILRVVLADGGSTGLWFGLVMGGVAWLGGILYWFDRRGLAKGLAIFCVVLVGGWFGYESFLRKGYADSEIRQLVVIVFSIVILGILVRPGAKTEVETEER